MGGGYFVYTKTISQTSNRLRKMLLGSVQVLNKHVLLSSGPQKEYFIIYEDNIEIEDMVKYIDIDHKIYEAQIQDALNFLHFPSDEHKR